MKWSFSKLIKVGRGVQKSCSRTDPNYDLSPSRAALGPQACPSCGARPRNCPNLTL